MAIATQEPKTAADVAPEAGGARITSDLVWRQLADASFAVIGYVTPAGEPRSSGVVYRTVGKRLYIVVGPDSWKARHIATNKHVSVTVPVHRGGVLALVAPIPPATISFHATALVHPAGSIRLSSISKELDSLLPPDRKDAGVVIELIPYGRFLTYGVGVSLMEMRKPDIARAEIPVSAPESTGSGRESSYDTARRVCSITESSCAADTNHASNCDGGSSTSAFFILMKNSRNESVSLVFASR